MRDPGFTSREDAVVPDDAADAIGTGPAGTGRPDEAVARLGWMRVLAESSAEELEAAWRRWEPKPAVDDVRAPEAGLVMVRARADAGGARFNLGEATVARATVRVQGAPLAEETLGVSYLLGIDVGRARLAAVFDGMLQDAAAGERVQAEVIAPLEKAHAEADRTRRAEARGTLVDFFTVSREHA